MGFFSSLFGRTSESAPAAPEQISPTEEVRRQIETVEGELHEAQEQLATTSDPGIKSSLESVVARKTQALADLQEKLHSLQ